MLRKKDYHNVVVGKNYLSLLFSLYQLEQHGKNSCLIIDDKNVHMGNKWNQFLGILEFNFLEHLFEVSTLIQNNLKLVDYLSDVDTMLVLDKVIIELGQSPYSNILELSRKWPHCFSAEFITSLSKISPNDFDAEVSEFLGRLSKEFYKFNNFFQLSSEMFKLKETKSLESLFKSFYSSLTTHSKEQDLLLYNILQILFQTTFSNTFNEMEAYYLLSSVLSPRYKIDIDRLEQDLTNLFLDNCGFIKETTIQDWEMSTGKVTAFELSSFEGLIFPKNIFLFGEIPLNYPFELKTKKRSIHALRLFANIQHEHAHFYYDRRIFVSNSARLGTDFPHCEIRITHNSEVEVIYSYYHAEGSKPSFYRKQAIDDVFKTLESFLPGLSYEKWKAGVSFEAAFDYWTEDFHRKTSSFHQAFSKKRHQLYSQKNQVKLAGVEYWGPARPSIMGLFSYLLELKSTHFYATR